MTAGTLIRLEIDEISLVDDGANQHAKVVLAKRRQPQQGNQMDLENLMKSLQAAETRQTELESQLEAYATEITKLKAEKATLVEDLAKAKSSPGLTPEQEEEEFLKGLPESVRNRMVADREKSAALELELAKLRDAAEADVYVAKAKALELPKPAETGAVLLRIAKGKTTAEDLALVEQLLKGKNAVESASVLLSKSLGVPEGVDAGDVNAVVENLAKAKQKATPGLSEAEAIAKVYDENPGLYEQYRASRQQAH